MRMSRTSSHCDTDPRAGHSSAARGKVGSRTRVSTGLAAGSLVLVLVLVLTGLGVKSGVRLGAATARLDFSGPRRDGVDGVERVGVSVPDFLDRRRGLLGEGEGETPPMAAARGAVMSRWGGVPRTAWKVGEGAGVRGFENTVDHLLV